MHSNRRGERSRVLWLIPSSVVASALALLVACGHDDAEGDDSLGGGAPAADASGDGAAVKTDGGTKTANGDGGTSPDAATEAGPPPRPTGPGAPPSRTATYTPDGNGFFTLQTAATAYPYVVRLPIGYVATTPYPLVLGLHGCGDNAQHFAEWAISPYDARATQSYVAVSLGGRDGGCWDNAADEAKVLEVYDDVRQLFYVHQKKVAIAGYSSGGMLAYYTGLRNAYRFSGILIENSGIPFADQNAAVVAAAEWKLDVAMSVHVQDDNFPIGQTRGDRDLLLGAGFPVQYRELDGTHDGDSVDWAEFLLPKVAGFEAP